MNYEILDHIRYYKTKKEESEGNTIITVNAYDNIDGKMVPSAIRKGNGSSKNITIRIKQADSPFPSFPFKEENQEFFIHEVLNLEGIHVQTGFTQHKELRNALIKMYFLYLKNYYEKSVRMVNQKPDGMALLHQFVREVLKPLFPSFFIGSELEVYPLIVPARLQQTNANKKEDKYFFYQRYIKRMQRYYQADKVIYLECPDFGYGFLIFPYQTELYHDPKRYIEDQKRPHPTFFRSNVGFIDMNAYYKHFGFLPIHTDIHLKGGE